IGTVGAAITVAFAFALSKSIFYSPSLQRAIEREKEATFSSASAGRFPYTGVEPRESERCHPLADNSRQSLPRCDRQPGRCHSACARIPFCSCPLDDSECWRAAPEMIQSSSMKKSRETTAAPATRLQCHRSWLQRILCRRWIKRLPG